MLSVIENALSLPHKVDELERAMLELPQVDCPVTHHYVNGKYVRQVYMKGGIIAIGHRHKEPHLNILVQGSLILVNEDGSKTQLTAPYAYYGSAGRKVAYVQEDVVWMNVYETQETDLSKLEDMFVEKSDAFLEKEAQHRALLLTNQSTNNFQQVIDQLGMTEQQLDEYFNTNVIPFPEGSYQCSIRESTIHGKGLFATGDINKCSVVCPVRIGAMKTPAERYLNHSAVPNAEFVIYDGVVWLVSLKDISGCVGGFDGEELTVDYKQGFHVMKMYEEVNK